MPRDRERRELTGRGPTRKGASATSPGSATSTSTSWRCTAQSKPGYSLPGVLRLVPARQLRSGTAGTAQRFSASSTWTTADAAAHDQGQRRTGSGKSCPTTQYRWRTPCRRAPPPRLLGVPTGVATGPSLPPHVRSGRRSAIPARATRRRTFTTFEVLILFYYTDVFGVSAPRRRRRCSSSRRTWDAVDPADGAPSPTAQNVDARQVPALPPLVRPRRWPSPASWTFTRPAPSGAGAASPTPTPRTRR